MGTIATLKIEKLEISYYKNGFDKNLIKLFKNDDKKSSLYCYANNITEEKEAYVSDLKTVSKRLDMLGYNLSNSKKIYDAISNKYSYCEEDEMLTFEEFSCFLNELDIKNFKMPWDEVTPKHYFGGSMNVPYYITMKDMENNPKIIEKMDKMGNDFWDSFDPFVFLRLLSQNEKNLDCKVSFEYYDLLNAGYIKEEDLQCELPPGDKFIIITEGSSDTKILKKAIEILQPEIKDFFKFIDMENNYPFTAVGELYKFVQGLNKLEVMNKILVIFDNDTVGIDKYEKSKELRIVNNIQVFKLPNLEEFSNFKCIGPSGENTENINGKAVSIECFLDLNYNQKNPPIVRWSAFYDRLNKYQGALINKEEYSKNFFRSLKSEGYNSKNIVLLIESIKSECQNIKAKTDIEATISKLSINETITQI